MKVTILNPPADLNQTSLEWAASKLTTKPRMALSPSSLVWIFERLRADNHWGGELEVIVAPPGMMVNDLVWALYGEGECVVSLPTP